MDRVEEDMYDNVMILSSYPLQFLLPGEFDELLIRVVPQAQLIIWAAKY